MKTKQHKYTQEELEILDYVENQHPESVPDVDSEKERYHRIFLENATKKKQISLRLLEADLRKLRTKALIKGIPYQTLISSVIHQYINGELVSKNH